MSDSNDVNKVFGGILNSGIDYELFVVQGYSDYAEIALKLCGKLIYVITIDTRRSGNVICRPGLSVKEILIKRPKQLEHNKQKFGIKDAIDLTKDIEGAREEDQEEDDDFKPIDLSDAIPSQKEDRSIEKHDDIGFDNIEIAHDDSE